jgi:hypothetical protein
VEVTLRTSWTSRVHSQPGRWLTTRAGMRKRARACAEGECRLVVTVRVPSPPGVSVVVETVVLVAAEEGRRGNSSTSAGDMSAQVEEREGGALGSNRCRTRSAMKAAGGQRRLRGRFVDPLRSARGTALGIPTSFEVKHEALSRVHIAIFRSAVDHRTPTGAIAKPVWRTKQHRFIHARPCSFHPFKDPFMCEEGNARTAP